ncbi:MAG: hypothetical protein ACXABF_13150, partial [Candidatus Thorarchaeota archaeon]
WGDTNSLPELTMITLSKSKDRIRKTMDSIHPWWKLEVDAEEVYNYFSEGLQSRLSKRLEETGGEESEIYTDKFKSKIKEAINYANKSIEEDLPIYIISGTKKTLIDGEVIAKSLDEDGVLHDNKTVMYVRQEIFSMGKKVIENFAGYIADSINEILEEI